MALEELDLEFEDEKEPKKGDALEVDVDLSFSASGVFPNQAATQNSSTQNLENTFTEESEELTDPSMHIPFYGDEPSEVVSMEEARKKAMQIVAPKAPLASEAVRTKVKEVVPQDHSEDILALRKELSALKEELVSLKHEAQVKVALANARVEYISENLSNAKVLDYQVTQILQRIHAKAPQLKAEVLTIKKFIGEFVKKSGSNS